MLFEQGVDSPLLNSLGEVGKEDILSFKFELGEGSRDFEKVGTGIDEADFTLPLILTLYNRREKIFSI